MCFITTIILSLNYDNKNINLNLYIFKLIYLPLCFIPLYCIFSVSLWGVYLVDLFLYIDICLLGFFLLKMESLNPGNSGGGVGSQGPGGQGDPGQNPNNHSNLIYLQDKDTHKKNSDISLRFWNVQQGLWPDFSPEKKVYEYAAIYKKWDTDWKSLTTGEAAFLKMVFYQHTDYIRPENRPLLKGLGNNLPIDCKNPILGPLSRYSNIGIKQDGYYIYLHMKRILPNYDAAQDELAFYSPKCIENKPKP